MRIRNIALIILISIIFMAFIRGDVGKEVEPIVENEPIKQSQPIKIADVQGWEVTKTGIEESLNLEPLILNETSSMFCINFIDKEKYVKDLDVKSKDGKNVSISSIPITKLTDDIKLGITTMNLSKLFKTEDKECFEVTYPDFKEGMSFKIGEESVLVNSTMDADATEGVGRNIYIDIYGCLNVGYTSLGSDFGFARSCDGVTWSGKDIVAGTYDDFGITGNSTGGLTIYASSTDIVGYASINNGTTWTLVDNLLDTTNALTEPSCATDNNDVIHCCAVDATSFDIYYANSTVWNTERLITDGTTAISCDLFIGIDNCVNILVGDTSGTDHVSLSNSCGGWSESTLFTDMVLGTKLSLSIANVSGQQSYLVNYQNDTANREVACTNTTGSWICNAIPGAYENNAIGAVNSRSQEVLLSASSATTAGTSNISNSSLGSTTWTTQKVNGGGLADYPSIADQMYPLTAKMKDIAHIVYTNASGVWYTNKILYNPYSLAVTEPTTASPITTANASNATLAFKVYKNGVEVTSGLTLNNIKINQTNAIIKYNLLNTTITYDHESITDDMYGAPSSCCTNDLQLRFTQDAVPSWRETSFIKFLTPEITNSGSIIYSANLSLKISSTSTPGNSNLVAPTSDWIETQLTFPSISPPYANVSINSADTTISVTNIVRGWSNGSLTNFGLGFNASDNIQEYFHSSEATSPSDRPTLTIFYEKIIDQFFYNGSHWVVNITTPNLNPGTYDLSINVTVDDTYQGDVVITDLELDSIIFNDTVYPHINFTLPTPNDGSTQDNNDIYINVSVEDNSVVSTFIDFDNSLVSWWRMDDVNQTGYGAKVYDYTGRNNGTAYGNATQVQAGKLGKGFSFGGSGEVVINDNPSLRFTNELTYSLWFKANDINARYLLHKGVNTDTISYGIGTRLGGDILVICPNEALSWSATSTGNLYSVGNWVFAAVTQNNSDTVLYVNGINKSQWVRTVDFNFSTTNNLVIGRYSSIDIIHFYGTIDDVMIFNRSLSVEEIQALYANQSSRYLTNNFTSLAEGTHTFKAYTQDLAGNVNSTELRQVTISSADTTPPAVSLINPANNTLYTASNSVDFNYSAVDAVGITNCSLFINNTFNRSNTGTTNFTATSIGNGNYNWFVNCSDAVPNWGYSGFFNLTVNYVSLSQYTINPSETLAITPSTLRQNTMQRSPNQPFSALLQNYPQGLIFSRIYQPLNYLNINYYKTLSTRYNFLSFSLSQTIKKAIGLITFQPLSISGLTSRSKNAINKITDLFSISAYSGRLSSIYRNPITSFIQSAISDLTKALTFHVTQPFSINTYTQRIGSLHSAIYQSISVNTIAYRTQKLFNSFTDIFSIDVITKITESLRRNAYAPFAYTDASGRQLSSITSIAQNFRINAINSRMQNLFSSVRQSFVIQALSNTRSSFKKSFYSRVNYNDFMQRLSSLHISSYEPLKLTNLNSRMQSLTSRFYDLISLSEYAQRFSGLKRDIASNLIFQSSANRLSSIFRILSNSLNIGMDSGSKGLRRFLISQLEEISISPITQRASHLYHSIADSFNINSYILKIKGSLRQINLQVTISDSITRASNLVRAIIDFIRAILGLSTKTTGTTGDAGIGESDDDTALLYGRCGDNNCDFNETITCPDDCKSNKTKVKQEEITPKSIKSILGITIAILMTILVMVIILSAFIKKPLKKKPINPDIFE